MKTLSLKTSVVPTIELDLTSFDPQRPHVHIARENGGTVLINIRGVRRCAAREVLENEDLLRVCRGYGRVVGFSSCREEFTDKKPKVLPWKGLWLTEYKEGKQRWFIIKAPTLS